MHPRQSPIEHPACEAVLTDWSVTDGDVVAVHTLAVDLLEDVLGMFEPSLARVAMEAKHFHQLVAVRGIGLGELEQFLVLEEKRICILVQRFPPSHVFT